MTTEARCHIGDDLINVVHILPSIALIGGTSRRVHDHIASSTLSHSILLHDCWIDRVKEEEQARATPFVLTPVCFSARDWARASHKILGMKGLVTLVSYFPKGHAFAHLMTRVSPRIRHVVSLPGLDHLQTRLRRRLFRTTLSSADFVFANSVKTGAHHQPLCRSQRIETIYNPVSRFVELSLDAQRSLSLLSCGGLSPVKEYHRALELCLYWSRQGIAYEYLLAGDGPLRGDFERFVTANGISSSVAMPGYLDLPSILRAHHVFIHPCDREGFGLAPVEAALSGVPVILARGAGAAEILRDTKHVLLVDFTRDVKDVSDRVLHFVRSVRVDAVQLRELRHRLSTSTYASTVDDVILRCAAVPGRRGRSVLADDKASAPKPRQRVD